METPTNQTLKPNFRAVNLSDLNAILKIYKSENNENKSDKELLPQHFGLPLYVAEINEQIIAYSYVTADLSSQNYTLQIQINKSISQLDIETELKQFSELILQKEWMNNFNGKHLNNSIHRFIHWLNSSIT